MKTPDQILKEHEDANEMHFHQVDREWIVKAMEEYASTPKPMKPDTKLIDSMALRYRHDFSFLDETQKDSIRTTMTQLWEEVVGLGFYKAEKTITSTPKQMKTTIELVEQWAEAKGILSKATPLTQAMKTQEEVNELYRAILDDNRDEIKDAIGDIMVTLIIQCKMQGMDLQDCLESAYNVIKNRTGKMVGGIFVKD